MRSFKQCCQFWSFFSHTRIISAFDKIPPKYGSIVEEIYGELKPENAAGISEKSKKFAIFPWTCDRRREPFGPFFNDKVRLPADWQWCHGGRWRQSWTYGSANCVNFELRRGAIFTNQPIFAMGKRVHEIQYLFEFVPFKKNFGRGEILKISWQHCCKIIMSNRHFSDLSPHWLRLILQLFPDGYWGRWQPQMGVPHDFLFTRPGHHFVAIFQITWIYTTSFRQNTRICFWPTVAEDPSQRET